MYSCIKSSAPNARFGQGFLPPFPLLPQPEQDLPLYEILSSVHVIFYDITRNIMAHIVKVICSVRPSFVHLMPDMIILSFCVPSLAY